MLIIYYLDNKSKSVYSSMDVNVWQQSMLLLLLLYAEVNQPHCLFLICCCCCYYCLHIQLWKGHRIDFVFCFSIHLYFSLEQSKSKTGKTEWYSEGKALNLLRDWLLQHEIGINGQQKRESTSVCDLFIFVIHWLKVGKKSIWYFLTIDT